jgi:hypothetical protein
MQNKYLKDLVRELKRESNEIFMPRSLKRVKGAAEQEVKYIMMSPLLAIVMQVLMNDSLIEGDWKVRQASINSMRVVLK